MLLTSSHEWQPCTHCYGPASRISILGTRPYSKRSLVAVVKCQSGPAGEQQRRTAHAVSAKSSPRSVVSDANEATEHLSKTEDSQVLRGQEGEESHNVSETETISTDSEALRPAEVYDPPGEPGPSHRGMTFLDHTATPHKF